MEGREVGGGGSFMHWEEGGGRGLEGKGREGKGEIHEGSGGLMGLFDVNYL